MPKQTMTDNEIAKALEYWKQFDKDIDTLQSTHPQYADMWDEQKEVVKITFEVFEEVNRQKAEIERLKTNLNIELENYATEYDNKIKSEAYREFAEKLHEELRMYGIKDRFNKSVFLKVVDKAKKELVGEEG